MILRVTICTSSCKVPELSTWWPGEECQDEDTRIGWQVIFHGINLGPPVHVLGPGDGFLIEMRKWAQRVDSMVCWEMQSDKWQQLILEAPWAVPKTVFSESKGQSPLHMDSRGEMAILGGSVCAHFPGSAREEGDRHRLHRQKTSRKSCFKRIKKKKQNSFLG